MSISNEDFQYMDEVMWDDALPPSGQGNKKTGRNKASADNGGDDMKMSLDFTLDLDMDHELSQLLSADEQVEDADHAPDTSRAAARMAKKATAKGEKKAPAKAAKAAKATAKNTKTDTKRAAKPADATGSAAKEASGNGKAKGKLPANDSDDALKVQPPKTSPRTNIFLSSPEANLIRSKKGAKLSTSMKGASQNKMPQLPASMLSTEHIEKTSDPYSLPLSQTPGLPDTDSEIKKTQPSSSGVAKISSPLGLIPASDKKPQKPQKRVAKRSFLDLPETFEQEADAKPAQVKPAPKTVASAPAVKQVAKAPRKSAGGKGPKAAAAASTAGPKPVPKPAPKALAKEKATEKATDKAKPMVKPAPKPSATTEKQPVRSFLVEKTAEDEDDPYMVPASFDDSFPSEKATKKLRPRGNKPSIIISSDVESSFEYDDFSDAETGHTTGNTTIGTSPEQDLRRDKAVGKPPQPKLTAAPAVMKLAKTSATTTSREKGPANLEVKPDTTAAGARVSDGPAAETRPAQEEKRLPKRPAPPAPRADDPRLKRQKMERGPAPVQKREAESESASYVHPESQGSSSTKMVHSVADSDPFVTNNGRFEKTRFTTKLLQSAIGSTPQDEHQGASCPTPHQGNSKYTPAPPTDRDDHIRFQQPHAASEESNQVAREMMQLLSAGRRSGDARSHDTGAGIPKDLWLQEADPYKDTSQMMGYVCKTLLRFLKTKEAAIEDVASEYSQRGSAVLGRIKELHAQEKTAFVCDFEAKRQKSLSAFDEAYKNIRQIAGRLERVSLVPAVNGVLSDDTVTRLRALQTEVY